MKFVALYRRSNNIARTSKYSLSERTSVSAREFVGNIKTNHVASYTNIFWYVVLYPVHQLEL